MHFIKIVLGFALVTLGAQNTSEGLAVYEDVFITSSMEVRSTYHLHFNSKHSLYILKRDSLQTVEQTNDKLIGLIPPQESQPAFYYKNNNSDKVIYNAKTVLGQYVVQEDSLKLNWQILRETKTIGKYKCTKALTTFKGRSYTAWFTEAIPVSHGPRKFSQLPGLILEIYDNNGVYKAFATRLQIPAVSTLDNVLKGLDVKPQLGYMEFLTKRCEDSKKFIKRIASKMSRSLGKMKLRSVGSQENLEVDESTCEN